MNASIILDQFTFRYQRKNVDALHAIDGRQLRKVFLEHSTGLNHGITPTQSSPAAYSSHHR